ncbi:MAG: DUF488 domain-containing protein [Hyphomicrobiaceae bacterium]
MIRCKRIYNQPDPGDGYRVLVDRLWPRGVAKTEARLDAWLRDIAPSTELRKWYHQNDDQWDEFAVRYRKELDRPDACAALGHLRELAESGTVTLLFSSRNETRNNASVLAELLRES